MGKKHRRGGGKPPDDRDYSIGFGKPPAEGKIRAGEIRNPHGCRGKPKDESSSLAQDMQRAKEEVITMPVKMNDETSIEAYRGLWLSVVQGGLKNPWLALQALKFIIEPKDAPSAQPAGPSDDDQKASAHYIAAEIARLKRTQAAQPPEDDPPPDTDEDPTDTDDEGQSDDE